MTKEISPRDDSGEPCECGHEKSNHLFSMLTQGYYCIGSSNCDCKMFKIKK